MRTNKPVSVNRSQDGLQTGDRNTDRKFAFISSAARPDYRPQQVRQGSAQVSSGHCVIALLDCRRRRSVRGQHRSSQVTALQHSSTVSPAGQSKVNTGHLNSHSYKTPRVPTPGGQSGADTGHLRSLEHSVNRLPAPAGRSGIAWVIGRASQGRMGRVTTLSEYLNTCDYWPQVFRPAL